MIIGSAGTVAGQERAKIRHDYIDNPTGRYSPSDPWTRSRIWKRQTGHWGRFYNCDGEEAKRNSPYICWKNANCPYVDESLRHTFRRDKARMLQRIADGSCNCGCKQSGSSRCACKQQASEIYSAGSQSQLREQISQASRPTSLLNRLQDLESESGEVEQSVASSKCDCAECVAKSVNKASTRRQPSDLPEQLDQTIRKRFDSQPRYVAACSFDRMP